MARDFRVLGPIEVVLDGRRVDLGGAKPRTVLAALIAHRNEPVSTESLIEALWAESPPATARKSLQKFVWALRKDLGKSLITRDSGYELQIDEEELDAGRLELAVTRSRDRSMGIEQALEDSLPLWRGNPYPELSDTAWGPPETARLVELRLEGEELLIDRWIAGGKHGRAIGRLDELIVANPFRERLWGLLMTALYGSGRQADALETYQRLRTTLGEHLGIEPSSGLRDLEERILLQDPELRHPPGATSSNNLPASVTSFVGRKTETAEIRHILEGSRLVTLLGPAGSGKTRLVTEVGRILLGEFADGGVWFVDLAPIRSPDKVIDAIADALGVGQFGERSTRQVVVEYLAEKRLMLILDNCEHLVGKVAEVAGDLLRSSDLLIVLATSRERLGIDGEAIFDVPPLPYPKVSQEVTQEFDAVRLFVERARSVARDEEIVAGEEVGEIVRRLDGIPLALELAAARVRTLGLAGLRSRLDDRFSVLTAPSRGNLQRHQTLEAALDWSYRLLTEQEQTLFTRLSVFSGGFDLESVGAVCGFEPLDEESIVDLVGELVDKSLVTPISRDGRRRYLLLESLREYGRSQIDPSDLGRVRIAHMTYFRDLAQEAAENLHGEDQKMWLAALRQDYDNLGKALRWSFDTSPSDGVLLAVALGGYWDSMGPRTDGNEWLARAVETSKDLEPALHIDALFEAASLSSSVEASIPVGYARHALSHAVEIGDELREGRALRALSWALALAEQPDAALDAGRRALEILERHGDRWEIALCLERIGQSSYRDPERSVEILERALQIYRDVGDRAREALALHKIADRLAHSLDDLDKALDYARQAVAICDEIGNTHDGGHARLEYGKILRRAGRLEEAATVLRGALGETTKAGDERCTIRSLTALGNTLLRAGEAKEAESTLREALKRGREFGEVHTTRSAIAGLARLQVDAGRPREAAMLLGFVERLSEDLDVPVSDRALEKREAERSDLRQMLDDEFGLAWEHGRAMSTDQAIGMALGVPAGQ